MMFKWMCQFAEALNCAPLRVCAFRSGHLSLNDCPIVGADDKTEMCHVWNIKEKRGAQCLRTNNRALNRTRLTRANWPERCWMLYHIRVASWINDSVTSILTIIRAVHPASGAQKMLQMCKLPNVTGLIARVVVFALNVRISSLRHKRIPCIIRTPATSREKNVTFFFPAGRVLVSAWNGMFTHLA